MPSRNDPLPVTGCRPVGDLQRTRIKICGLRQAGDVRAAVDAGADAIGLVFYRQSLRFVDFAQALELTRLLPPFVTPVGLFVNAAADEIDAAVKAVPNLLLQFHGDETPSFCGSFARPFMKVARMTPGLDLLDFARQFANAQAILVDAHVDAYGGGGKVFDWSLIPADVSLPVVLSGGLHAGNVIQGIRQVRPWAVDVSSGVESERGIKDAASIRRFCEAVREADARRAVVET
ncbi:MAG: phosphoribosylanthranilate isomerase [Caldimonas sp.]